MRLLSYFLLLGCLTLFSSNLFAITFVGGFEGNVWTDYRNWDPQQVPGSGDEAVIPQDRGVTVNGAITVGSLILSGGLNSDGNPNSKLTIVSSFSWINGSVSVPVFLELGCAGLWQGNVGMSANITNHGQVTCDAGITISNSAIINYGELDVVGTHNIGVYYSPATVENHGLLKKPIIDPSTYSIGVLLLNHPDGDIVVENGELYASIHCQQYGDVEVLSDATFHTHTLQIYDDATFTGDGRLHITGNGATAENTNSVTVDIAEVELNANGIGGAGDLVFTQHFTHISGGLNNHMTTFTTNSVVDVNPGGLPGLTNTTINNGTFNFNANFTFSYGSLTNNGTVSFNGAHTVGIYAASPGIYNHGTAIKPVTSIGTFLLNLPLHNESDGDLLVQKDELHCAGGLDNKGDVIVSANTTLRVNDTHIFNGATLTGAGTYIIQGNGIYADNTSPVSIDIAETNMNSNVGGTGPLTFTAHINWTTGGLNTPVTFASTCIVDVNGNVGISVTATNNGTMNVNSNMTFSYGGLTNNGLMSLNGPYSIGIYAASSGILNHGTVQKPTSSAGTYTMGVPLYNESDGHLFVAGNELHCSSNLYNSGEVVVNAGCTLRGNAIEARNGGTFNGAGTFIIQHNGLTAANTSPVSIDVSEVVLNASIDGAGVVSFTSHVNWTQGDLSAPVTFALGSAVDMNPGGGHGITGTTTNNGTLNINTSFTLSAGQINNNGLISLNGAHSIGIYYGTPGVFNHGTVKKPTGSTGTYNFNVPLTNYSDGQVIVQEGILRVGSEFKNAGSLSVSAGATFKADRTIVQNGASFSGAGTYYITYNGLDAQNTSNINFDVAEVIIESSLNGNGPITFAHHVDWQSAGISNPVTIAIGGVLDITTNGYHSLGGDNPLTNNGTINMENSVSGGTINNNGTLNKTNTGDLNIYSTLVNNGTVQINEGNLYLKSFINAGTLNIPTGASAILNDENYYNPNAFNAGTIITGGGTFRLESHCSINADLTIDVQHFVLAADYYAIEGAGSLTFAHDFEWQSGYIQTTVVITSSNTLTITGGG
ncbi:MAG: hypothetical protein H7246_15870, partial [Phycisphaerae bacterium]|nr:hypothetical protein [Saprospiraceae bacterium]